MSRRIFRTQASERGAVIPIVALLLPVLMVMTGFAIDLGRQRVSRRDMQAVADVVALDMARLANGRSLADIHGDPIENDEDALAASADRNDVSTAVLQAELGHWDGTTFSTYATISPTAGYFADPSISDPATAMPNAARVTASETTDYYFQPGSGSATRTAIATLVRDPRAEFLLGSTLLEVTPNQDWLIGKLLSFIIPGADVLGYDGLANAEVSLADLGVGVGAGTVEELLDAQVTLGTLLDITAEALSAQGNTVGLQVLTDLRALVATAGVGVEDLTVSLGDLLGLATTDPDAGLVGTVSVPQLLALTAVLSGGENFLSIPPTVINVAGLAEVGLNLHVIEAPIRVGSHDGASGTTKQVGVDVSVGLEVGGSKDQSPCALPAEEQSVLGTVLGAVFNLLDCLLPPYGALPLTVDVDGTISLGVSVAGVTAEQAIHCPQGQLSVGYTSSPLEIVVNTALATAVTFDDKSLELLEIQVPVSLGGVPLSPSPQPDESVLFEATDAGPVHRTFADITDGTPGGPTATVGGQTLGLNNLLNVNGIKLLPIDPELPTLGDIAAGLVQPMINDIVGAVDSFLVAELSRLLGLNLGAADITPQWMDCDLDGSAVLVR